ncbi:hypothetical protein NFC81_13665 [Salinispirillum sp. LH 10-3-1]|uniref:Catalase n=1 Tax=Salinispirillum sp. LH 10-3-1 TaxID=2952525 RepID=A0AB38YFB2_9GAMM
MSTMTGMFPNAITTAYSLERPQVPSTLQNEDSELFPAVKELEPIVGGQNRRELNPEERLMGKSERDRLPQRNGETEEANSQAAMSEQQLRAAKRRGELDAQQRSKLAEIERLSKRDREVRQHEQAHQAVGGQYTGAVTYQFVQGPDGRRYAVAGEVSVDLSPAADPEETIQKMEQIKRAALAPSDPSGQDRRIAAEANAIIAQARAEALKMRLEEGDQASEKRRGLRDDLQLSSEERRAKLAELREAEKEAKESRQRVDDDSKPVNTEVLVQLSRTQQAISELLRNQSIQTARDELGKLINAQI